MAAMAPGDGIAAMAAPTWLLSRECPTSVAACMEERRKGVRADAPGVRPDTRTPQ